MARRHYTGVLERDEPWTRVRPSCSRPGGVGAALVARVHAALDEAGVDLALLHYSPHNVVRTVLAPLGVPSVVELVDGLSGVPATRPSYAA